MGSIMVTYSLLINTDRNLQRPLLAQSEQRQPNVRYERKTEVLDYYDYKGRLLTSPCVNLHGIGQT